MSVNYKDTVFLPKTDFPMRANLPQREPEILKRWEGMDMYRRLRDAAKGREKYILHDGPPYANGHIHMGTAMNKILKDVIVRSQQMLGFDANYVPGWDCHGLPIEWKIEEKYRAKGKDKDQVPIAAFRKECRDFAAKWIDTQRTEFKRLGVVGDWENPYLTMTYAAEAAIVAEIGKFLMNGSLYRGAKPVLWSVVEKTALAEAEVEYHDHTSDIVYVRFPVAHASDPALDGAAIVIWTTTPWTLPGNRAIAYGEGIDYTVVKVNAVTDEAGARAEGKGKAVAGETIVVAEALLAEVAEVAGIAEYDIVHRLKGGDLAGTKCRHPFAGQGYDFDVPVYPADFVEVDTGTGFVHIAPGHGYDDWVLGQQYGVPVACPVDEEGIMTAGAPGFEGEHVFKVNPKVMAALDVAGKLLASGKLVHSYPHSWRSKAPLIFRNTPQWFIGMEQNDLRAKALKAIEDTRFFPAAGQKRLHSMIAERPDWCVSRQRAWGVPITVFVHKKTGEPLKDPKVQERIVDAVREGGADVWFNADPARFLGDDYAVEDYDQVTDILDVWFDSGSTHAFVLEERDDLQWPASLYLEGSDQHRGWFHSSLLESCGTRGRAPYDRVLTHGFVMAEDGQKMSKSLGNTLSPQDAMKDHGADILRLWVVGSDYAEDLRIGPEILKRNADIYRRLRNTLRYLLGNLNGFEESERLPVSEMPELERWVLHRLWQLDGLVRKTCETYEFHPMFVELHNFCAVDLSAFYFDIRKDTLYCDPVDSTARRAARTVLDVLFNCLTAWLAPIACFTAEEAWQARHPDPEDSVHLRLYPDVPAEWKDRDLAKKWEKVRKLRSVVTGALEIERAAKRIGSSLEAHPTVYATAEYVAAMAGVDLAEIAITSGATLIEGEAPEGAFAVDDVAGVGVVPGMAEGEKCARCWKVLDDVGSDSGHPEICGRCAEAVAGMAVAE